MSGSDSEKMKKELVQRLQKGEKKACKELYEMYKDKIYSTSIRFLKNFQDAEDASQEIFLKVFRNINRFREDSSLNTWIYRIAVNTCMDRLKLKAHKDKGDDILEMDEKIPELSREYLPANDLNIIENEIQKLPEKCRAVFILRAIEDFKHEEISDILEISIGTSKSQYFNAKNILRKSLLPYKKELLNEM
ncbi:MAG: sigma-70 family RNA polymerase sigma factor [bacterium]|nr:sigma-70 family RNA polymerase sigma factor [bacterium]